MFVDFSEFDAFDVFVLLFEEELFSLIFLIFFSSASELLIDGIELLDFGLIEWDIFLLAVFDESFEVSFSFVEFEAIGLFVVFGVIGEDLMEVVELEFIVGVVVIELGTVGFFVGFGDEFGFLVVAHFNLGIIFMLC